MGGSAARAIVEARENAGPFRGSRGCHAKRTGLQREAVENLVTAGAFDPLIKDRRSALWEVGLRYLPVGGQQPLDLPVEQDMAQLPLITGSELMLGEYQTMGLYPTGHLMKALRPGLGENVLQSDEIPHVKDGVEVTVAGIVVRRQRPLAKAVFITLEDEFGHAPIVVWPQVYERYRLVLKEPVLKVRGMVSRREGTLNIVLTHAEGIQVQKALPKSKDWANSGRPALCILDERFTTRSSTPPSTSGY